MGDLRNGGEGTGWMTWTIRECRTEREVGWEVGTGADEFFCQRRDEEMHYSSELRRLGCAV